MTGTVNVDIVDEKEIVFVLKGVHLAMDLQA
jgi:hypothetical protein